MADQRPLHHPRRRERGDEHRIDAATPEAQEERVAQLQPGEEGGDADHRGAGSDATAAYPSAAFTLPSRCLHWPAAFFVSTFGGV